MNITPALGLGDLLVIKMKEKSNNLIIKNINILYKLIKQYRKYPEKALDTITNHIKLLFPETKIFVDYDTEVTTLDYIPEYNFTDTYLYDLLNLSIPNKYNNYIVFHTKVRLDRQTTDKFIQHALPLLDNFFKDFKTDKTIIILGEKKVEECFEQKICNIISIYDNILQLSANNKVIDLTETELYSGNTSFDMFLNDIEIINKADMNICFGLGGPFNLCQAFSKNNICYVSNYSDPRSDKILDRYISINKNSYRDIEPFIHTIYKTINI